MADVNTLQVTGYSSDGFRLSLIVALDADSELVRSNVARLIADVRAAGMSPRPEGVEVGEDTVTVHAAVRREQLRDGKTTPILDLYTERGNYREKPTVYLNTPEEIAAFESVSGIRVADLPTFEGDNSLERDNPKFAKYVRDFKRPVTYVRRPNPAHETDSKKPQYKFVRWQGAPTAPQPAPAGNGNGASGAPDSDVWDKAAQVAWWVEASKVPGMNKATALAILGDVKALADWTGGKEAAYVALDKFKQSEVVF